MGEHTQYQGDTIKIGTCENMYYLRADQRHLVPEYDFALDVERFRFPFPDEDDIEPGAFEDHGRGVKIPGYALPETLSGDEHGIVQFIASAGYNVCLPCPEGPNQIEGLKVHRNGWNGAPVVRQQALRGGLWVTLVSCGACGCLHRLDTITDAEPVIEAFLTEAARTEWRRSSDDWDAVNDRWSDGPTNYADELVHGETHRAFLLKMAERITAGYMPQGVRVPA